MRSIILSIYLLLSVSGFSGSDLIPLDCHRTYSPEELQEDLNILLETLDDVHPDLNRVIPYDFYLDQKKHLREYFTEPASYLEFLTQIAILFTRIGDIGLQWGHSKEYIEWRNENLKFFPLQLNHEAGKVYLVEEEEEIEVLQINDYPIDKYVQMNYDLLPVDGRMRIIQKEWLCRYFPNHHTNFWEQVDTYQLEVKLADGKTETRTIDAVPKSELKKREQKFSDPLEFSIQSDTGTLRLHSLKLKDFGDREAFRSELDSIFQIIQEKNLQKIIVDVTGVSNGSLHLSNMLLSYFITKEYSFLENLVERAPDELRHQKHIIYSTPYSDIEFIGLLAKQDINPLAFDGMVELNCDGWNYGAIGLFCAHMNKREKTFLKGDGCGAARWGMNGYPEVLKLPNTGIIIIIPRLQFQIELQAYFYHNELIPQKTE